MQKKPVILAFAALVVMSALTLPVSATSVAPSAISQEFGCQTMEPRWGSTTLVVPSIAKAGRNISASLFLTPKKRMEQSTGRLYLEQYIAGHWQEVASWTIRQKGTVAITKSYTGKSKAKYRTKVVVAIGSDRITATSTEIIL